MLLAVKFAAIRAVIDYIDDKSLIFSVKMKDWFSKNNVKRDIKDACHTQGNVRFIFVKMLGNECAECTLFNIYN